MKIVRIALIGSLLVSATMTFAQENVQSEEHKHGGKMEALEQLELSEEQQTKVNEVVESSRLKMKETKADTTLTEEQRHTKMKEIKGDQKTKINEILTDEQIQKLETIQAERKAENEKTPEEIAERQTAKMKEALDLTADQELRVKELNLKVAMKIDAIKKNDEMTPERKKEFIQGNKNDQKNALKTILTDEQFAKYEEMLASKKKLKSDMRQEHKEAPGESVLPEGN